MAGGGRKGGPLKENLIIGIGECYPAQAMHAGYMSRGKDERRKPTLSTRRAELSEEVARVKIQKPGGTKHTDTP